MQPRTSRHAWQRFGLYTALGIIVLVLVSQSWVQADPIRTLTPSEQTTEAYYLSRYQTSSARIPPPKVSEIVPTSSPQPPINFITGCGQDISPVYTKIENCWIGTLDGRDIIVYALWNRDNPNHAVVRVFPIRVDGTLRGGYYYTPQAIGPVRITAVNNGVLTLTATRNSSQRYLFNVRLRQYYDANGNQLASGVAPDSAYPPPNDAQPSAAYPAP